jgi:two-component system chemotaxis response regulator CheB
VILTDNRDDGVAGLAAIKGAGGLTIVQDPESADVPELPLNVIAIVPIDQIVPLEAMGAVLLDAVGHPVPNGPDPPEEIKTEAYLDRGDPINDEAAVRKREELGRRAAFMCPECGGSLARQARRQHRTRPLGRRPRHVGANASPLRPYARVSTDRPESASRATIDAFLDVP